MYGGGTKGGVQTAEASSFSGKLMDNTYDWKKNISRNGIIKHII